MLSWLYLSNSRKVWSNNFREDLNQHFVTVGSRSTGNVLAAFFEMSLWAIGIFRFGKWARAIRFYPIRLPFMLLYFFLYKISQALSGIRISLDSEIGPGLVIHNFGGAIVHGRVGKNCVFVPGAQMISAGDGKGRGYPTLGNSVYVGAGAKILGNVVIGDQARIGANAVVIGDVPAGAVVLPPVSRIIRPGGGALADRNGHATAALSGDLRERVVALLEETLCHGEAFPLDHAESMLGNGILSSLGVLMLAESLATRFGIVVEPDEIMPENLDSVDGIVDYVQGKGVAS